ncbi:MAG: DUF695 domain-containing protein [Bacteroidota bacterium]
MRNSRDWDFYFCSLETQPASIMVNLAQKHIYTQEDYPHLLSLRVPLLHPNDYGLTSFHEAEILYLMEDQIAEHIIFYLGARYVARLTSRGQREYFFYCKTRIDINNIIEEVMGEFPDYQYEYQLYDDPSWTLYHEFLYPTPQEYQSILNRHSVNKLEEMGDVLVKPREVVHTLCFPTFHAMHAFTEELEGQQFNILHTSCENRGENPFILTISRKDAVDQYTIDQLVSWLLEKALKFQGGYKGWKTRIIKRQLFGSDFGSGYSNNFS